MITEENMLDLMYITNDPKAALIAESAGVNRIFVDMEYMGKEARQKGLDTVKNHHTVRDVKNLRKVLTDALLLVRVNPLHHHSKSEIDEVIAAGADIVMLPMWKSAEEVKTFIDLVGGRAKTMLLLETSQAMECVEDIVKLDGVDEIHIGLNDLRLSLGRHFIFEPLADGTVEHIVDRIKKSGIPYGFGGFGMPGEGILPADLIIAEHYRLGSSMAILSRSFCDLREYGDNREKIKERFDYGISKLRKYEEFLARQNTSFFEMQHTKTQKRVQEIVAGGHFV